ncbi:DUF1636 family protein [Roseovarius sp. SK2]|uniref:DUF1636 family protein n=1 Tax=Roseovarius TaxID=74030 RepID=UPI001FECADE9|nr:MULTISPECIES: DUF1636 family protein [Roseovarius]MDD9727731.1 DUF1636 family protein [Roseovarius sp. SK2]
MDFGPLREELTATGLADAVSIVERGCMNGCASPVSMAMQGPGRAIYFFNGVDPAADAEDIVATLHAYLAAPDGWIEDAQPCGRLRFCLVGRVPALSC